MSLEELKKRVKERLELDQLPETVIAKLISYEFRTDKQGRECLYINLITKDGKEITQKYTDFHLGKLIEAMDKLKLVALDQLKGQFYRWKTVTFRIGNPRLIPVEKQEKL